MNDSTNIKQTLIGRLPKLTRFALVLCREKDRADDLVQATCERALSRLNQFQEGTKFDSWLFSIMHSIWKNDIRKANNSVSFAKRASETSSKFVDGEKIANKKVFLNQVLYELSMLPSDQAAALTLVCLDGLSYRDAAEVLNIPQGTLESRVARGRIALGRALEANSKTDTQQIHSRT